MTLRETASATARRIAVVPEGARLTVIGDDVSSRRADLAKRQDARQARPVGSPGTTSALSNRVDDPLALAADVDGGLQRREVVEDVVGLHVGALDVGQRRDASEHQ